MNRRDVFGLLAGGAAAIAIPALAQPPAVEGPLFYSIVNSPHLSEAGLAHVWVDFTCGCQYRIARSPEGLTKLPDGRYSVSELRDKCPSCSGWTLIPFAGWIKSSN
jgi:hypothetical protein